MPCSGIGNPRGLITDRTLQVSFECRQILRFMEPNGWDASKLAYLGNGKPIKKYPDYAVSAPKSYLFVAKTITSL